MGYINDFSQLMKVAPAVLGCIKTITAGYASDKTKRRGVLHDALLRPLYPWICPNDLHPQFLCAICWCLLGNLRVSALHHYSFSPG